MATALLGAPPPPSHRPSDSDVSPCSEVYKGFSKLTRTPVAIKIIDLEAAQDEIEDIQQEIAILSQLDSPFVTKYFGSWLQGSKLWIVMEYCAGGSCADLVRAPPFPPLALCFPALYRRTDRRAPR